MDRFSYLTPSLERAIVQLARQALLAQASHKPLPDPAKAPAPMRSHRAGVFVTVVNPARRLRGCWGTVTPTRADIAQELIQAAAGAAVRDTRFKPLRPSEVAGLSIYVSLIGPPEPGVPASRIDPLRQGVLVRAAGGREAVALPHEGKTVRRLSEVAREKARIGPNEPVEITPFRTRVVIGKPIGVGA